MKALLLLAAALAFAHARDAGGNGLEKGRFKGRLFVERELVVKYRSGASLSRRGQAAASVGAAGLRSLSRGGDLTQIRLEPGRSVAAAIAALKADPAVEFAQPNYIYHASAVPNDPSFSQLWGLRNTGQTITSPSYDGNNPGSSGNDMSLATAWNTRTDCSSTVVAVIDSGVHVAHGDLAANIWVNPGETVSNATDDDGNTFDDDINGWDFVDDDNTPIDLNGHGTHVAGTIGAVGNNGTGTTGVCWQAKLMAVRVLDATGAGTTADIVAGVNYAVDNGAKVINMSLGGGSSDPAMIAALDHALAEDVVVVVAAGNDGANNDSTATYPCNYSHANLVCVAALDQAYQLASFSNYGATSVDIGAPGTNIRSTWNGTRSTYFTDTFETSGSLDWTRNSVSGSIWNYLSLSGYDILAIPSSWNGSAQYANNTDARVYQSYNLGTLVGPVVDFWADIDTQASDYFRWACRSAGGDPFAAPTHYDEIYGSTDGYLYPFSLDLSKCAANGATVGFQLASNGSGTGSGVAIIDFTVSRVVLSTTAAQVIDGTSMATPHVAGLAALVRSQNTSYTAAETIEAIKNGGRVTSSLCGVTTTSRAADAAGSVSYIRAPEGVTAVAQ